MSTPSDERGDAAFEGRARRRHAADGRRPRAGAESRRARPSGGAHSRPQRGPKVFRRAAFALTALVSVAVLAVTGYLYTNLNSFENEITRFGGTLGNGADGAIDILLVGIDSRTDAQGNPLTDQQRAELHAGDAESTSTDTIILIRIPNDGSSATALSIPRDTYVDIPGYGKGKINAAYATAHEKKLEERVAAGASREESLGEAADAGRDELVKTVAELTGVEVDHYAEVGLIGFALLTDAVGGVDVCLNNRVNDAFSGARFPKGKQRLNGPQALSFVRQRHGLPRGDIDRIVRQQAFMASLAGQILATSTLTNPSRLNDLSTAIARSVVLDDDWDVIDFARKLQDLSGGNVKFSTIPVTDYKGHVDDQDVVLVDATAVRQYVDGLLGTNKPTTSTTPDDRPFTASDYTVDIGNSGTVEGMAARVAAIVKRGGFTVGDVSVSNSTIINSRLTVRDDDDAARDVAERLGGVEIVVDTQLPKKKMVLTLTDTYIGPGATETSTPSRSSTAPTSGSAAAPTVTTADGVPCVN